MDHAAIWVDAGGAAADLPRPAIGDAVRLVAAIRSPGPDRPRRLDRVRRLEIVTPSVGAPAPVEVAPDAVATGGPRAIALDGALVVVRDVAVVDPSPAPGPGDAPPTHQFVVEGGLRIDDDLFRIEPAPIEGSRFRRLAGVLGFDHGHQRLLPRAADDVERGAPVLASFGPPRTSIEVGAPAVPVDEEGRRLTVAVDHPVALPQGVALESSDPASLRVPAGVEIPAGSRRAEVVATGVAGAREVTVTASLDGRRLSVTVDVYDPESERGRLLINELDYDQVGEDRAEFIEILNPTAAPVELRFYEVMLINGSDHRAYARYDLGGAGDSLAPGAYLVIGAESVLEALPPDTLRIPLQGGIQNGEPDGVLILNVERDTVDSVAYGSGRLNGVGEGDRNAPDDPSNTDAALARCPDGRDTDQNGADFRLVAEATPGAPNACP